MPDEPKLGPNLTYTNPDGDAKEVQVSGLTFKENEPVDLHKALGEGTAAPILKKYAKNRFFKVDGGPDHGEANQKAKQESGQTQGSGPRKPEDDYEGPDEARLENPAPRRK